MRLLLPPIMEDVFKIALGVFIGSLAAVFAWEGITYVRLEIAAERARQEIARTQREMRDQQRAQDRANAEADQRQRDARQRREDQARAADEARRQAERDKAAAWSRYYKPSAGCVADPTTVPCANEHMKARKLFEVQYGAGTIR